MKKIISSTLIVLILISIFTPAIAIDDEHEHDNDCNHEDNIEIHADQIEEPQEEANIQDKLQTEEPQEEANIQDELQIFEENVTSQIIEESIDTFTISSTSDTILNNPATQVDAFVTRLYTLVLNRQPETSGLNYWTNQLTSRASTGASVAHGFFFSQEMRNRGLNNNDFVEVLYNTLMNRASDASGKTYWVDQLNAGKSRESVFAGFVNSPEFTNICNSYGITRGSYTAPRTGGWVVTGDITLVRDFVTRLYVNTLQRQPDASGLNFWTNALMSKTHTGASAAHGFFFSQEMRGRGLNNSDFTEILYTTLMGRGSDAGGKAYWVGQLNSGVSREKVFAGFVNSAEFTRICQNYGITRGTYTAPATGGWIAPAGGGTPVTPTPVPTRYCEPPWCAPAQNASPYCQVCGNIRAIPTSAPPYNDPYSYSIHILNPGAIHQNMILNVFVRTNAPSFDFNIAVYPSSRGGIPASSVYQNDIYIGGVELVSGYNISNIVATQLGHGIYKVQGGYILAVRLSQVQKYNIAVTKTIQGHVGSHFGQGYYYRYLLSNVITLDAQPTPTRTEVAMSSITSNMTTLQKLRAVENHIINNFYYFDASQPSISIGGRHSDMVKHRAADSITAPGIIREVALSLGIPAHDIRGGSWAEQHAGGLHHSLLGVKINGVEHIFNPTPSKSESSFYTVPNPFILPS